MIWVYLSLEMALGALILMGAIVTGGALMAFLGGALLTHAMILATKEGSAR